MNELIESKYGHVENVSEEWNYRNIDYRDTTVPLWNHLYKIHTDTEFRYNQYSLNNPFSEINKDFQHEHHQSGQSGVCLDFQKGQCQRGDGCQFLHIVEPNCTFPIAEQCTADYIQRQINLSLCASIIQLGKSFHQSMNTIYEKLERLDERLYQIENKLINP